VSVHTFLVTAPEPARLDLWADTAPVTNWIEGRIKDGATDGAETWLVTCFDVNAPDFLATARAIGVTVEEIEGGGDNETYILRVGKPGTGWQS